MIIRYLDPYGNFRVQPHVVLRSFGGSGFGLLWKSLRLLQCREAVAAVAADGGNIGVLLGFILRVLYWGKTFEEEDLGSGTTNLNVKYPTMKGRTPAPLKIPQKHCTY